MQNVPVFLTVAGRACVVIGGGPVGTRKARMLLDAGARVTVVTPQATAELEHLARECGALSLLRRDYRPGDLAGSWLAFAATGVPEVQDQVATDAERERIWFNAVDEPARCSFITPAVVERGPIAIAVSTGGASPALAGAIRRDLDAWLGQEYEQAVRLLGELRDRHEPGEERQRAFLSLIDRGLVAALREGDGERVLKRVEQRARAMADDAFARVPRRANPTTGGVAG